MTEREINTYLVEATEVPYEQLKNLLVLGQLRTYPKKHVFTSIGQPADKAYFLVKGIVRHFAVGNDKEEITKHFMGNPDFFVASIPGFFLRELDHIQCDAITDCVVIEWKHEQLMNFAVEHPKFYHFLLKRVVMLYKQKEQKEVGMHIYDARERYEQFVENYPDIAYEVPLRFVASYLNIRPETLSRIRAPK